MRTFFFSIIFGFMMGGVGLMATAWVGPTFNPPAGSAPAPINVTTVGQTKEGGLNVATGSGARFGVGTTAPASLFSVGASSQFQVNTSGNIARINNVPVSFPAAQGVANTLLQNDGAGNLSWQAPTAAPGPTLRFTRAIVTSTSTVAQRDTQCSSEFGSNYYTAHPSDVAVHAPLAGVIGDYTFYTSYAANPNPYMLLADLINGFNYVPSTGGVDSPVACVRKDAILLFTRFMLDRSVALGTKDGQCATEFGSKYRTASDFEVATYAHLGGGLNFLVSDRANAETNLVPDTTNGFSYLSVFTAFGSFPVACIKFSP